MRKDKKVFSIKETMIFITLASLLVGFSCSFVMYRHYTEKEVKPDYSSVIKDENLIDFLEKYEEIVNNYYEDVDRASLTKSAISGMLEYLGDPYTSYLDDDSANSLLEQLEGKYSGVGIEVSMDETSTIRVTKVFDNSPAKRAGLEVGDIFVSVNDKDVAGRVFSEVTDEIKYGENPTSKIVVLRNNKEYTFEITRSSLYIPSVETKIIDKNIGYMSISTFSNTTPEQVKEAIKLFNDKKVDKVIIDLRNNTGGYLHSAKSIIEQFLEKDKTMYSIKYKNKEETFKDTTREHTTFKIAILVNRASASASEIMTGALKESYGAIVVGTTTFGKGKVQQTSQTASGGLFKYTSAKWLLPSGECIDGVGIKPDYEVESNTISIGDTSSKSDDQLKKAIEVIKK